LAWDFVTLRIALAALLLFAALMKSEQLWSSSPQPFTSPTFALIVFEFVFAAWLLTGWLPRVTWWLAVACFTVFALVAGTKLLWGEPDCGCFGNVQLLPVAALLIDVTALTSLLTCRRSAGCAQRTRPQLAGVVVLVTLPIMGLHLASREGQLVEVAPGLKLSTDLAVVDPSQWVPGTRFSLLPYIKSRTDLNVGEWTIVLIDPDCQICRALTEQFEHNGAEVAATGRTAVISVAPSRRGPKKEETAHLVRSRQWIIQTPLVTRISDGLLTHVKHPPNF